jgi:hypothetical protein
MRGNLRKSKSKTGFMVELPTKNGLAIFAIPESAKFFRDSDATDGMEVTVERDAANRIVKVTIPGKHVLNMEPKRPAQHPKTRKNSHSVKDTRMADSKAVKTKPKASPKILGAEFHNPYTFIPFEAQPARERTLPTQLTADELDRTRRSGVLVLSVKTLSPLITSHPEPQTNSNGSSHKCYHGLCIGDDVVLPASGIRGVLRTLMTILTSGTLGYVDRDAYLTQGRDVKLGPRRKDDKPTIPKRVALAEVISPGNKLRDGTLRLGNTKLVPLAELERLLGIEKLKDLRDPEKQRETPVWIGLDNNGKPSRHSESNTPNTPWRLRLSGQPVGGWARTERKQEALYQPQDEVITIPSDLWAEYLGRNRFGIRSELAPNDLVWLEPAPTLGDHPITQALHVVSLQWARWGKRGIRLLDKIPKQLLPDAWNPDGKVDEVTDLFGQVSESTLNGTDASTTSFTARIRPDNLVFEGLRPKLETVVLAPLSNPHPGCLAFYRSCADPDKVSYDDHPLRGYKVYRNTQELGPQAPWLYDTQGVYEQKRLKLPPKQKTNTTVQLVPIGSEGMIRISFRGLTERELALLIQTCSIPWRLGGGKPLGLGRCQIVGLAIIDEDGIHHADIDNWLGFDWRTALQQPEQNGASIASRAAAWTASQTPVRHMRYPRAIKGNARGGHAWFTIHAKPRAVDAPDSGKREAGLTPIRITGELAQRAREQGEQLDVCQPLLSGQTLPIFNPQEPQADVLYGYDLEVIEAEAGNAFKDFKPPK